MKLRLYLHEDKKTQDGKHPVKAEIRHEGKYIRKVITNINKSDWNPKSRRMKAPRTGAKENGHVSVNERLNNLEKGFNELILKCQTNKVTLTREIIQQFLNGKRIYTGKEKPFWDAYQEYLSTLNVAPKTKQNYELYRSKLKEFEQETGYFIDYSTITPAFNERYKNYILKEKDLSWNTYATAIKKLKFFLKWGIKMEYHQEIAWKKFSATEKEPTVIFLTEDELNRLYNWDFQSKRLNQVRDLFCFGCFTGLAYADIETLKHDHIQDGTISKHRKKSKKKIDTPLPVPALKILEKYSGHYKPLPRISNQKLNDYIRECAQKAGINSPVVYLDYTGGKITEKTAPKYTLLSSHNARKTFITLYYEDTKDYAGTKENAGISQDKTMRRYIGRDRNQAKENMKKAFTKIITIKPGPEREDYIL